MSNVRWFVIVSKETDRALRAYLARKGSKKSDISRFVNGAVLARLFELSVRDLKQRNRTHSQKAILKAVEEALEAV